MSHVRQYGLAFVVSLLASCGGSESKKPATINAANAAQIGSRVSAAITALGAADASTTSINMISVGQAATSLMSPQASGAPGAFLRAYATRRHGPSGGQGSCDANGCTFTDYGSGGRGTTDGHINKSGYTTRTPSI